MSNKLDAALGYASRGWAVLPLWPVVKNRCACGTACGKNAGKHPLGDLVKNGVHEATTDSDQITRWWLKYPQANVGVATGAKSGIFVLDQDIDKGGGEVLESLITVNTELPDTLMTRTGNKGLHYWFKYPGTQVRNLVGSLAGIGLDVRGDYGYVVAPPSTLGEGKEYDWVQPDAPVVEAPDWLQKLIVGPLSKGDPLDVAAALNGVSEGQRDITMFRLACRLRAVGVPPAMTEELLVNAARACTPPFDEDMARDKVARAYRQYSREYAMTDAGNAERLVDRHGPNLRYSTDGRWLSWNGQRWNGDQESVALNLAVETTGSIISQANETVTNTDEEREKRDAVIRHAYYSQNVFRLQAMVTIAKSDPAMLVPLEDLDADPMLLNCLNGTVDLRNGALRPHNRGDFITKMTAVAYQPEAQCPKWEAFLDRFLPDPEVKAFVQRAIGYGLTGSVAEQCLFFFFGSGRNGKSTLIGTIQRLMGQYARTGSPDLLVANKSDQHPTTLADLVGARLVPTIETEEGKRMAEATTKWLTGGDVLKARRMRHDYFEFMPKFKIFLIANHRPVIYGTDVGIWRRIHLVPFEVELPEEEKILNYDELLISEEGPGIMAWAVRGAMQWAANGLQPPAAVKAAVQDYRVEMDLIGQFITECVAKEDGKDVAANDMYNAYVGWCRVNGELSTVQRKFSNKVFEQGYRRERGVMNKYFWQDVVLTPIGREYAMIGMNGHDPSQDVVQIDIRPGKQLGIV